MEAVIIIPTHDINGGAAAAKAATGNAGVSCGVVLIGECERRGGVIPTNAGLRAALQLEPPYIVHLNDDAVPITNNWLARIPG